MMRQQSWPKKLSAMVLVAGLTLALVACGSGTDASGVSDSVDESDAVVAEEAAHEDEAAHVEGDEADDAQEMEEGMAPADAEAHVEGDDHEADDGHDDAEANAYLEAAPKDALYLVEMTNFAFAPSTLEVDSDQVLEIAIQNVEPVLHDFTIDKIDADVHISYLGGTGQHAHAEAERDADVHFALTEPASGVVHLKISEPGEYVFYCTVPGHQEAGMEGTLIVR